MIDHFTNYAQAAPCLTASKEETSDHLKNVTMARHVCQVTFQSDMGKAFVGDLAKELMTMSQAGQPDHLSPADKWPGRETKSPTMFHATGLLLTIHGRLG